jgi:hypothetical protein
MYLYEIVAVKAYCRKFKYNDSILVYLQKPRLHGNKYLHIEDTLNYIVFAKKRRIFFLFFVSFIAKFKSLRNSAKGSFLNQATLTAINATGSRRLPASLIAVSRFSITNISAKSDKISKRLDQVDNWACAEQITDHRKKRKIHLIGMFL